MGDTKQIPLEFERFSVDEMSRKADEYYNLMAKRRSVRYFTDEPVPRGLIERAILTANTAPSGAHKQPWTFIAIKSPDIKKQIRVAAEREEKESYEGRMSQEWLDALKPFETNWKKPYLETVPWIVICFAQNYGLEKDGKKIKHYYVQESCGIACGMFISALHHMGLATLTHTPSPMRFLSEILRRPKNEKPYILFPVGYPSKDAVVPDIHRKSLALCSEWL